MPWTILLFVLFGGLAIGCGVAMVAQRNPLYSAISLVGVFLSLAGLYVVLAAPFIAAVQVIVYAGAIMVLVVFVIMLLNVEEEARRPLRRRHLIAIGLLLGAVLIAETAFMLSLGGPTRAEATAAPSAFVGTTKSIGTGLFTEYLLPFEVTSILILMALVGAITLARQETPRRAVAGGEYDPARGLPAGADLPRAGALLQAGQTEATGQAYARAQIERNETAGRVAGDAARKNRGEE